MTKEIHKLQLQAKALEADNKVLKKDSEIHNLQLQAKDLEADNKVLRRENAIVGGIEAQITARLTSQKELIFEVMDKVTLLTAKPAQAPPAPVATPQLVLPAPWFMPPFNPQHGYPHDPSFVKAADLVKGEAKQSSESLTAA